MKCRIDLSWTSHIFINTLLVIFGYIFLDTAHLWHTHTHKIHNVRWSKCYQSSWNSVLGDFGSLLGVVLKGDGFVETFTSSEISKQDPLKSTLQDRNWCRLEFGARTWIRFTPSQPYCLRDFIPMWQELMYPRQDAFNTRCAWSFLLQHARGMFPSMWMSSAVSCAYELDCWWGKKDFDAWFWSILNSSI